MLSNDENNSTTLNILGISGSLRKGSFNTGLLRAARELAPADIRLDIFNLKDIPLYNGDVEAAGDPESVSALKAAIRNADGVLFATPEYNHSISGVLKNAIDWASRDRSEGSLQGKPVAMMGAGGMAGTARSQMHLENVLAETGSLVMVKPGLLVTFPWDKFNEAGRLTDEDTRAYLRRQLLAFAQWVRRVGAPGKALAARS
jgi:chromate reductase, NAD(P)H dehydrogenase (quinone)